MMEGMEADGNNNKSILAGCEYELSEPFGIHQVWQRLLLTTAELPVDNTVRDSPALIVPGRKQAHVTFGQLEQRAAALAQKLWASRGVDSTLSGCQDDWIIAVCLPPSTELIVSLLAIFKLGAAYLPLDPAFPSNRVAHILDDAKPALLITSTAVLNEVHFGHLFQDLAVYRYDRDDQNEQPAGQQQLAPVQPARHQDLAVVLYTSGSTGTPKGVRLTHRNIYHRLNWQWRTFPFIAGEVCCFKTALTFVDSIAEIWAPLLRAVPIVIIPKIITQNPEVFIATLESHCVTRLVLVPSLMSAILAHFSGNNKTSASNRSLQQLRLWVCSGEVLSPQLLRQFFHYLDGRVCNFYGSTEVTGDVTCVTFGNSEDVENLLVDNRVPLGSALDNCAIYILSPLGEVVDLGQIGEVFVSGAHVAEGYINGTKTGNTASFVANAADERKGHETMYRTGDYGRIVNGQLYYEGRADSQIKVRGHRIDLTEINAAVLQLDQVIKGVVLCYKPGQPEQEIIAFVVTNSNPSSIHQCLKKKLVSYAMPRVVVVGEIPLLVNGKIDRQLLLRDYAKNFKSKPIICRWNENELNRLDERERNVASALLKTVLSVLGGSLHKPLSLTDNYFYVGGNSLNAVSVVTKLRDQGFYLELGDFLEADNFHQVVIKMEASSKCRESFPSCAKQLQNPSVSDYKIEMLNPSVKEEVKRITCECFSQKGDLELLTGVKYEDYEPLLDDVWQHFLDVNLSFTVKNIQGRTVACGMNCDAFDVPKLNPRAKALGYVFEVLEHAKGPARW
ncbi:tyrocidine synthase 3-like isoform X2 [Daphnia pulicaria]|uniref:tyrocidine synthase 3-like isoform X2 n=1 Tax=Daphnia pulicaria TaxID=35523 RepID=UPI001EECDEA6|nr:tyrocidine synthase 3-like isoform X2 [Daphnia pulicaria]